VLAIVNIAPGPGAEGTEWRWEGKTLYGSGVRLLDSLGNLIISTTGQLVLDKCVDYVTQQPFGTSDYIDRFER